MTQTCTLPQLTTDRLTLRAPVAADMQAYQAFYAATDMTVGTYRGGRSTAEIADIHAADMAHWQNKGFGIWLLRRREQDTVLGGAGLVVEEDWDTDELTWWLMPQARGHGYATEASRAIIAYAYDTLGWSRVQTFMRDENIRSHKMAQRLGGTVTLRDVFPDGVTRDVYVLPREVSA
ncbi:MAG: GNAT family N-acetyltransferase [Roseovarius sp.]